MRNTKQNHTAHPRRTHLTLEGLDAAVDVLVLLQAGRGGEGLAALCARVAARAHVLGPDVTLQVAGVGEDLVAVLARVAAVLVVRHLGNQNDETAG